MNNNYTLPEPLNFDVTCSQSLSRTVRITTNDYIPLDSGVDYERDGEGGYIKSFYHDPIDTSSTNWADEYHSNDYHTPLQLIQLFGKVLQANYKCGIVFRSPKLTEKLIKECKSWVEDDLEYVRN